MGRIFNTWLSWSIAVRWISGIGLFWVVSAILPAFRERNPAAAFGENFVALGLHYGLMLGSIAVGIWLGPKIVERTGKTWIAWVFGIGLFVAAVIIREPLGNFFGVSDKLDVLLNPDCYIDWDGRSNSTVCEQSRLWLPSSGGFRVARAPHTSIASALT